MAWASRFQDLARVCQGAALVAERATSSRAPPSQKFLRNLSSPSALSNLPNNSKISEIDPKSLRNVGKSDLVKNAPLSTKQSASVLSDSDAPKSPPRPVVRTPTQPIQNVSYTTVINESSKSKERALPTSRLGRLAHLGGMHHASVNPKFCSSINFSNCFHI